MSPSNATQAEPTTTPGQDRAGLRAFLDNLHQLYQARLEVFSEEAVSFLQAWCDENRTALRACHLGMHEGGPAVYMTPASEDYDLALETTLLDLEMALFRQGHSLLVMQIPARSVGLSPYSNERMPSLQVYPARPTHG